MHVSKPEVLTLLRACRRLAIDAEMVTDKSSRLWCEQHRRDGARVASQCAAMMTSINQRGVFDD